MLTADDHAVMHPAPPNPSVKRWPIPLLQLLLVGRALWNVAFVAFLAMHVHAFLNDIEHSFITFTVVDGALAAVIAIVYALAASGHVLWWSQGFDAVTRFVLVGLLQLGPGVSAFPVTATLFLGVVAAFATLDGVVDVVEGAAIRKSYGAGMGGFALTIGGLTSVVAGVALFLSNMHDIQLTAALAVLSAAHAFAHLSATRRARRLLEQVWRHDTPPLHHRVILDMLTGRRSAA